MSGVSLLFRMKTFRCVSLLWKTKSTKEMSRQQKINILHKANRDHITNTHVALNEKISSSSALSFGIDESERKEICYLNPAFKRVNYLAI